MAIQKFVNKLFTPHIAKMAMTVELAETLFGQETPTPESATVAFESVGFPAGTKVLDIDQNQDDRIRGTISIIVSHIDLPKVMDGCVIPTICPTFRKDFAIVKFDSWGV